MSAPLIVDLTDGLIDSVIDADILTGPDPKMVDTYDEPEQVVVERFEGVSCEEGKAVFCLPPLTFAAMTLGVK